jgi:hypothetical protein
VAFSGFANDTAWFLFGALLLGVIATRSGIARRLVYFIMLHGGITYPRILLGLILTNFLLTFIVPSGIARLVIMASIALGLAEAFKSGVGSNVSRGMFLILSYTANIFDKMNAPGAVRSLGGVGWEPRQDSYVTRPRRTEWAVVSWGEGSRSGYLSGLSRTFRSYTPLCIYKSSR